jgi:hypothetical protein
MSTPAPTNSKPRKIIGISMSPALAVRVKTEAKQRDIRLKQLFEEMWELYEKYGRSQKS